MRKQLWALLMSGVIFSSAINPMIIRAEEGTEINSGDEAITDYSVDISSRFSVAIPKLVTLSENKNSENSRFDSNYQIKFLNVDIRPDEYVQVSTPADVSVYEKTSNKEQSAVNDIDVNTEGKQSRIREVRQKENSTYTGYLYADGLTAGDYVGTMNFRVALGSSDIDILSATDSEGRDLNASATVYMTDEMKSSLTELANIKENDITGIINVNTDNFKSKAEAIFDVSSLITDNCKQFDIYHYNEKISSWEYISTETADNNGRITAYFNSFSPVAFIKNTTLSSGLYDTNGKKLCAITTEQYRYVRDIPKKYSELVTLVCPEGIGFPAVTGNYYKKIIFPKHVGSGNCPERTISPWCFMDCTNLEEIEFPEGCDIIEWVETQKIFHNCSGLKRVTVCGETYTNQKDALTAMRNAGIPAPSDLFIRTGLPVSN